MQIVVRIWIVLSALLVASGWVLSGLHELNRAGYLVVFALASVAWIWWSRKAKGDSGKATACTARKWKNRFQRPAPFLFLVLLFLSFVAGSVYAPFNGDSQAYRIPRVLHWLDAQQWHWISTLDLRMNVIGTGFEWLSAPLILFTGADRFLFLINVVSYAMLPGLIYSVFKRLGVAAHVAWWWMWILPSGWCFALQAGSVVNDSFAAVYALAAIDFALRAKEKSSIGDFLLSLLAAALLTGAKQCDIPLVLPWFIAAWPALGLLRRHAAGTVFVVAIGLLVSALPITVLNLRHTGNWLGASANPTFLGSSSPFWGIVGNAFCIPIQNLMPPFFPVAEGWNALMDRFVATPFGHHFSSFEHFGQLCLLSHSIGEGDAGIGLGICALTLLSIFAAWRLSVNTAGWHRVDPTRIRLLRIVPWLSLLLFMAKDLAYENARQLSPYYALFFPLILAVPGHALLVRRRWWQWLSLFLMLCTAGLLVISRNRPLFPAQTVMHRLHANHPGSHLITRLEFSFDAVPAAEKMDPEIMKALPAGETVIGYATTGGSDEPELWFPFGQRRVRRVLPGDKSETLRSEGIRYVVVDNFMLDVSRQTIAQWVEQYHGETVTQASCLVQPDLPPNYLYLVRLQP